MCSNATRTSAAQQFHPVSENSISICTLILLWNAAYLSDCISTEDAVYRDVPHAVFLIVCMGQEIFSWQLESVGVIMSLPKLYTLPEFMMVVGLKDSVIHVLQYKQTIIIMLIFFSCKSNRIPVSHDHFNFLLFIGRLPCLCSHL